MTGSRAVPCPTCAKPAVFEPSNPLRPFCCERCRSIDLGAWASEAYSIPAKDDDGDPGAPRDEQ